jgi:fumarate reductase subunit C
MFAAAFSGLMLLYLFALSRGREAYDGFLRWLKLPVVVAVFAVILVALLYHMGTWFRLTTRILLIRLGRRTIPRVAIAGALVAAWLGASALVLYVHVWLWR